MSDRRRSLIARFTARPGAEAEVARLVDVLGSRVRKDPGTLLFRALRGVDEPRRFVVWEQYEDESAFRGHIARPHVVAFNEALSGLIEEPSSELEFLDEL